ncbi:MAG: carbamoyltransferase [Acidobacteriota bacterium]|nr:carbamoyltransferase [Acidobacteriota bacterium]
MSYALGIICYGRHESAAVVVESGRVVAAAEEERFSRRKFDADFPARSIDFCLRQAGISATDLIAVGYGFDPRRRLFAKAAYAARRFPLSAALINSGWRLSRKMNGIERDLRQRIGYDGKVFRFNHHLCHAASTFFASPFDTAAILTLDGAGDWESAWWGKGAGTRIDAGQSIDWPQSLGHVYSAFTEYLGFEPFADEYKVMGLAAYGEPRYLREMSEIFHETPRGYHVDLSYFNFQSARPPRYSRKLIERFGPPLTNTDGYVPQRYRDVAASAQRQLERIVSHLARRVVEATGERKLCLAGGVAMNSLANGRLLAEGVVDELYVPPCASDAGVALGAAYLAHLKMTGTLERAELKTAALGPEYDDAQTLEAINGRGLNARAVNDPASEAARLVAEGKIVGWFQGRMEFGQRALGNRSILADPRRAEMKETVNARIKFREPFRPFAPSVLAERAPEYFDDARGNYFMTRVCPVRADKREVIPAVTHVDGTARVQTVERETSPLYWKLIKIFSELTSVPVVLNTSFNVKGQPIVNTPSEAVETFLATALDALVCGNYLITRNGESDR